MLKINEIAKLYEQADELYRKYRKAYFELKRDFFENAVRVKYSAGGTEYPAGKYFWGESKVYRKVVRKSSGHFCKTISGANYVYGFSEDGRLLALSFIPEPQLSSEFDLTSESVDRTGFCVYDSEYIYVLTYDERNKYRVTREEFPELGRIGIIKNTENCKIMAKVDSPDSLRDLCTYRDNLDIIVIDKNLNNEYYYLLSRGFLTEKYDLASEDEYPDFMVLNKP